MVHVAVIVIICALLLILVRWFTEPDERLSTGELWLFARLSRCGAAVLNAARKLQSR